MAGAAVKGSVTKGLPMRDVSLRGGVSDIDPELSYVVQPHVIACTGTESMCECLFVSLP